MIAPNAHAPSYSDLVRENDHTANEGKYAQPQKGKFSSRCKAQDHEHCFMLSCGCPCHRRFQ